MSLPRFEPIIAVGLLEDVPAVSFELVGQYQFDAGILTEGAYRAFAEEGHLCLTGHPGSHLVRSGTLNLKPLVAENSFFTLHDVVIGKKFHWERSCNQMFRGELSLTITAPGRITAINRIPLETYLASVISSEMSPKSPYEFLKAHGVIARSWLLHQLTGKTGREVPAPATEYSADEIMCWTGREAHKNYDICADDHCQRYQGLGRVNAQAQRAVEETRGTALVYGEAVCDARYSKCCGGRTENFSAAWEDILVPYLQSIIDSWVPSPVLSSEAEARAFILSRPQAYCNLEDRGILTQILPEFDSETRDFFRWRVDLAQDELRQILLIKTGVDFGNIQELLPLARGSSGRLFKIKVCGTRAVKTIGKELEIRRVLSPTHLLSSAFVAEPYGTAGKIPDGFSLTGAGWGHGVGLCQIGAAAMAVQGKNYQEILSHYFFGAGLKKLY